MRDLALGAIDLMSKTSVETNDSLWRAIHAWAGGQEIQSNQPTLASVAFIAGLSAFSNPHDCIGDVTCSRCGNPPLNKKIGKTDAIVEDLATTLQLNKEDRKKTRSLIRKVYDKQRSSYVHDAVLRHAEMQDGESIGRPAETRIVGRLLEMSEDLTSVNRLARRSVIARLTNYSTFIGKLAETTPTTPIRVEIVTTSAPTRILIARERNNVE